MSDARIAVAHQSCRQVERWRLFFGDYIISLYNYIYYTVFTMCKHGLRYHESHHLDLGPMKIESLFEQRQAMLSVTETNKQPLWASLRGGLLHITYSKLLIYHILRSEMWSFNIHSFEEILQRSQEPYHSIPEHCISKENALLPNIICSSILYTGAKTEM